jgi:ABC-type dipeptide/oligopeptide/nickel transport system ATPase component
MCVHKEWKTRRIPMKDMNTLRWIVFKLGALQNISHIFEMKNDIYITHDISVWKKKKILITYRGWILSKSGEVQIFRNNSNKPRTVAKLDSTEMDFW